MLLVGICTVPRGGEMVRLCTRSDNWRASVASETLTGVTQSKIGDVCLFIYLYIWTYVCHFVL